MNCDELNNIHPNVITQFLTKLYERVKSVSMPSKNVADALYVFKQINAKMTRKRPEMKVNEEKLTLMELELKKLIETASHYT